MQRLIQTEEFYRTIDLVGSPVILIKEGNIHHYHNKAFLSQIGYTLEDAADPETWLRKLYPDEVYRAGVSAQWQEARAAAEAAGSAEAHLVVRICCHDQSYKWFDVHESTMEHNRVVTFLDVNELYRSNERLSAILDQKDVLLSVIAHDVRSPLSNIRQIVENYKEMDLSAEEVEGVFLKLDDQIEYIYNLISTLLLRTTGAMGIFEEKREMIPLGAFFQKYKRYYRERLAKKQVELSIRIPEQAAVVFDPFILDVISRNLIDNAIKFAPERSEVEISLGGPAGADEVVIRDQGAGMSEDQIQNILGNKTSRQLKNQLSDGFGLGLIMAKAILEKNQGQLLIESRKGGGTAFKIRLN